MAKVRQPLTSKTASRKSSQQQQLVIIGAVTIVVVAFFAILVAYLLRSSTTTPTASVSRYKGIYQATTEDGAPIIGDPTAKSVLLEFADFSCPHCLEYHPTIQQFIDTYVRTGQARLIFRAQTFVGGNASAIAAQAALCAGKQGSFWEMHDALFDLVSKYGLGGFDLGLIKSSAEDLGINGDQLVACVTSKQTAAAVDNAAKVAQQYGLTGTPGIMFSTDGGLTFKWFNDASGKPLTGGALPLGMLGAAVTNGGVQ